MASLVKKAGAWCNGEVAYLTWQVPKKIEGCLGFMVTRVHETGTDAGQRRILPTWIAFTDQSNPDWLAQDASVWPIQSFEWRDLTLRKSRDTTRVRPIDFRVHYEIVPVGTSGPGRQPIPASPTAPYRDANGKPRYTGTPRPLFTIGDATKTNAIDVTHKYGDASSMVEATFTNGILSTQNLLQQLHAALAAQGHGAAGMPNSTQGLLAELKRQIVKADGDIRTFLTGDVLPFVRRLLDRAADEGGEIYLALYELHDPELIALLKSSVHSGRVHLILSATGAVDPNPKGTPKADRKPAVWDTENNDARLAIHKLAPKAIQDRMFDSKTPIGHNKFAVYVKDGTATTVMTGSTNWTETGLCTQSNNVIIIENTSIAKIYLDFWHRLTKDVQPKRVPLKVTTTKGIFEGAAANNANQGQELRNANKRPFGPVTLAHGSHADVWFSPNTNTNKKTETSPMPGDLNDVYSLMDHARKAILFLTFMPGESGKQNIIGEAAKLAESRPELLVYGAISDPSAMPNYLRPKKGAPKPKIKIPAPSVWWPAGDESRIAMVRATAISTPFGDMHPELLSAGHAIIHDKIIVIDPLDKENCAVITGSHNLGYKASYDNDENLLIIRGNQALAVCYAIHVVDIYQHYLMRAKQEDQIRKALLAGKKPTQGPVGHGFLQTTDKWQDRLLAKQPANLRDYFLGGIP